MYLLPDRISKMKGTSPYLLSTDRRHRILEIVNEKRSISVDELTDYFPVSTITIRRDLDKLKEPFLPSVSVITTPFFPNRPKSVTSMGLGCFRSFPVYFYRRFAKHLIFFNTASGSAPPLTSRNRGPSYPLVRRAPSI